VGIEDKNKLPNKIANYEFGMTNLELRMMNDEFGIKNDE